MAKQEIDSLKGQTIKSAYLLVGPKRNDQFILFFTDGTQMTADTKGINEVTITSLVGASN